MGFVAGLKSGALAGVVLPLIVATLSLRMVFYYSVSAPCHTPTSKRIIFTSTLIFHILMKFIITCLFGSSLFTIAEIMNVTRSLKTLRIELKNNKLCGLSPPGGSVSPPGGFSFLSFDQVVPYYSQCHLADRNAIYILHR